MGVRYSVVAMFGLAFYSQGEVDDFIKEQTGFEDVEELESGVVSECLDLYSSEGYIVGYKMKLGETVDPYQKLWDKQFPNCKEKPEPHMEVRVS